MSTWDGFRRELDAIADPERRADWARQILARFQRELSDDPPSWLLEAAGSRALEERDPYGVLIVDEKPRQPAGLTRQERKAKLARQLAEARAERQAERARLEARLETVKREAADLRRKREEREQAEEEAYAREFEATFGLPPEPAPPKDPDERERFEIAREFGLRVEEVI